MIWLLTLATALAADTFAPPDVDADVYLLDNGLPVLVEQMDRTDETALFIQFHVGARDEADGEHGCAHLFEHLMFEGSANAPGSAFDTWLTAAGGRNNAWTSLDETVYYMVFPSGATDLALFLESDRLAFLDAGLTAENLSNQQDVVLQERREGYAAPHGRDQDALMRLLFPAGHPYHTPVIGTEDDVRGFTLGAVQSFWQRHYRPRNATLIVVGPEASQEMAARVARWFDDVVDTGEPAPRPEPPRDRPADAPREGWLSDRVDATTVYLSWPTVPTGHDDESALELLSWILDDGPGTQLHEAFAGKRPIEDFGAWTYHAGVDGLFTVALESSRWPAHKLAKKLRAEIDHIAQNPPSSRLLDRARAAAKASLLDGIDTPSGRATALMRCYELYGEPDCFRRALHRYDLVTTADISRVARTWLRKDTSVQLTVLPEDADPPKGAVEMELP